MFFDPYEWEFTQVLEDNWQAIRDEFNKTILAPMPWFEHELNKQNGWHVYPIYAWPKPIRLEPWASEVPFTASLIDEYVPSHGTAGFSKLKSGIDIPLHRGYTGDYYRYHLGIDVPSGDLGLEVSGETRVWQNGKSIVFSDLEEHRAWNHTDKDRIVLLIDFKPRST
jgi:aspartyl/asparaginyl beta-hydroxylase (cupin superfamily)